MATKKNRYWLYLFSFLFFLLGVSAAGYLVHEGETYKFEPEGRDTMFVKMVDPLPVSAYPDWLLNKPNDIEPKDTTTKGYGGGSGAITEFAPQVGDSLKKKIPENITERKRSLETAHAYAANKAYKYAKALAPVVIVGLLLPFVIFFAALLTRSEEAERATVSDADPEDMQALFAKFAKEINLLKNPRKILRFTNNAKYHYYFMEKNRLNTPENNSKMMRILLEIQKDPSLVNIEDVEPEKLANPQWFLSRIKRTNWFYGSGITWGDKELLQLILKLNVDLGK